MRATLPTGWRPALLLLPPCLLWLANHHQGCYSFPPSDSPSHRPLLCLTQLWQSAHLRSQPSHVLSWKLYLCSVTSKVGMEFIILNPRVSAEHWQLGGRGKKCLDAGSVVSQNLIAASKVQLLCPVGSKGCDYLPNFHHPFFNQFFMRCSMRTWRYFLSIISFLL